VQPADVEVHNDIPVAADVHVYNEATPDAQSDGYGATNLVSSLIRGAIHGEIRDTNEQPNEHAKIFFKLLQEAEKELYPCCSDSTKVSFIVQNFQLKCMYGISNRALEGVLILFSMVLPKGHCVPDTMEKVQRVVRDLGLDYVRKMQIWIHVPYVASLGGKYLMMVLTGVMQMVVLIRQM